MSTRTYGGRTAEQIKAAAQAATPGPWETHPRGGMGYDVDPVESGLRGMVDRAEDAAHIAASNPAVVLEMLAYIAELEAAQDATSAALRGYPDSDLASLAAALVGRVAALEGALREATGIILECAEHEQTIGDETGCDAGNPDGGGIYPCDHCIAIQSAAALREKARRLRALLEEARDAE